MIARANCIRRRCRVLATLAWGAVIASAMFPTAGALHAQAPAGLQRASRAELAQRIASLEKEWAGGGLKDDAQKRNRAEIAALRNRLEIGDFRVGDRFLITLRRDTVLTDTASVRDSLRVSVLSLPDLSLHGVLRSELNDRMSAHVARFLLSTSVRTSVLTRVAVLGAVRSPGYFYISPDRPLSDLIMVAGGPAAEANLRRLEVYRSGGLIVRASDSDRFVKEGRTLEQVDVQSGDEVRIPVKRKLNWQAIIQLLFVFTSLFFALVQFLQWYYNRQDQ